MKRFSRIATFALVGMTVLGLGAAGLAWARPGHLGKLLGKDELRNPGKRISKALARAGVDDARVQSILDQAKSHRFELASHWFSAKGALADLKATSPANRAQVQDKVQSLLAQTQDLRNSVTAMVEEAGAQLSATEKANLVLNFADRFEGVEIECGSRVERVLTGLVDRELITEAEAADIQARIEAAQPELCGLRDGLKTEMQNLRSALANRASDNELENTLAALRANRQAAHDLRFQLVSETVSNLSAESQVQIASKLHKLQRIAELVFDLEG